MKNNLFSLKNKVICLIGYSGLIGRTIHDELLNSDAKVICGARNKIKISDNKNFEYYRLDISDEKSIKEYINTVVQKHKKIDVLINAALPKNKYSNYTPEKINSLEILSDINSHLLGYFNVCRYTYMEMKKHKKGSIINLGSIHGEIIPDMDIYKNTEIKKPVTYFINKAGVHILSKYFAEICAKYNIRVNTVAPGGIYDNHSNKFQKRYSDKLPLKRMGKPKDVVGCVLFLASDSSSYLTGQTLFIDGGLTLR